MSSLAVTQGGLGASERQGNHFKQHARIFSRHGPCVYRAESRRNLMTVPMSAEPPNHAKRITVLLIDDEVDICAVWSMVLEMEGMTVVTAPNGIEGLMKAKSFSPDVVICDFMMPGMNGLEVCAAIRAEDALRKASIVLWSAARGIDGKGLADLVVEKPVDTEKFIEHIHAVALQGRR